VGGHDRRAIAAAGLMREALSMPGRAAAGVANG
jgi:hypothetical protein